MSYVQGFITPVAAAKEQAFATHARAAAPILRELGATRVVDTWGDDIPPGEVNDFRTAVAAQDGETVSFGWLEFPDKATRDRSFEQMMADPRMEALGDIPFDGKRAILGGFETILDEGASNATAYVDGFLLSVPAAKKQAYLDMARLASTVFRDHGVSRYVECWGDDVPAGEVTDMARATLAEPGEVAVFSWCEWPDKATRDAGMQAMQTDDRMKNAPAEMPFDGKRMIFGGFTIIQA